MSQAFPRIPTRRRAWPAQQAMMTTMLRQLSPRRRQRKNADANCPHSGLAYAGGAALLLGFVFLSAYLQVLPLFPSCVA